MQADEPEDGTARRVVLDSEDLDWKVLSGDGQALCLYSCKNPVAHAYRAREETGKDPVGFMRLGLSGVIRAVSGSGNRVIVLDTVRLEMDDVGNDASKLVCQIGMNIKCSCALNEDCSEAAFVMAMNCDS